MASIFSKIAAGEIPSYKLQKATSSMLSSTLALSAKVILW